MTREEGLTLVQEHLPNRNLQKHSLAVEACMKGLARHFNEDIDQWGLAGLVHDLDYEYTVNTPLEHTVKTAAILRPLGVDEAVIHAIQAHNQVVTPHTRMDIALSVVDPTSGFLIACALMHPQKKLKALEPEFIRKRFKEKSFAKGASRERMAECGQLGLELDTFLGLCLAAMQGIDAELGL